ncbi:hypothetical protein CDD82_1278 [Ophiocordyceps australis]|uniref:Uncharacterized protein n=1 Tax=Ophiocordyceps australis TaxID=1399860 RepID=A0A2C5YL09_9HYPO|nr:hypothetical protein CDD82_1278 [Ophiocordyceps australis]
MLVLARRSWPRCSLARRRTLSTLASNPEIKVFANPGSPASHLLSYLDTQPPNARLAIGSCTALPPTPPTFSQNARFVSLLNDVVSQHGHEDPDVVSQAQALAGRAGRSSLGGWVHLSDRRNPPDFGRTAWPEDILGSVEVSDAGKVVGRLQPSGTYRIVTNEGILGLSPFMQAKLLQRLKEEESRQGQQQQ